MSKGSGIGWWLSGSLLVVFGVLFSLTFIGAFCGIPMVIAGIPMAIYGGLKHRQYSLNRLTESIRSGIVEGSHISATQQPSGRFLGASASGQPVRQPVPTPTPVTRPLNPSGATAESGPTVQGMAQFCGDCGAKLEPGSRFCATCGAPQ